MIVASLLAGVGWYLFASRTEPLIGLLLLVSGGCWLAQEVSPPEVAVPAAPRVRPRFDRWMTIVPMSLIVMLLGSMAVLDRLPIYSLGYLAAIPLLVLGALALDLPRRPRFRIPSVRLTRPSLDQGILLGVFIVALAVRLWQWPTVPLGFHDDEVMTLVNGRKILDGGPLPTPFDVNQWRVVDLHSYQAALMLWLGADPKLALMLLSIIPGSLAVVLIYLVARAAFGLETGLAAAALLGLNRYNVTLSREGPDFSLSLALGIAAVWLAWRAMRTGRLVWFVLTGVVCGLELVYLWVGAVAVLWVPLVWLLLAHRGALSRLESLGGFAVSAVVALGIAIPRVLSILNAPHHLANYPGLFVIVTEPGAGPLSLLRRLSATVLAFSYTSPSSGYTTLRPGDDPLFDPIAGFLTMVGIGYLLFRLTSPWCAVWFAAGFLGFAFPAISTGPGATNWRLIMATPALAIGGALVLRAAAESIASLGTPFRRVSWAVGALAIVLITGRTYQDYFRGVETNPFALQVQRPDALAAGQWLRARSRDLPTTLTLLTRELSSAPVFQAATPIGFGTKLPTAPLESWEDLPFSAPFEPAVRRVQLITSDEPWSLAPQVRGNAGVRDLAQLYYPPDRRDVVPRWDGKPMIHVVGWDRAAIEARRGLVRDPGLRCRGGEDLGTGGWRGLMFVEARGRYRLRIDRPEGCANLGLRSQNVLDREIYLARGWHEVGIVTRGETAPKLTLARRDRTAEVPDVHLYGGSLQPLGLLATFAESASGPAIERRYLRTLDEEWNRNPPTENAVFHMRVQGIVNVPFDGTYELTLGGPGEFAVTVNRSPVALVPAAQRGQVLARVDLAAGEHALEVAYQSPGPGSTFARLIGPLGERRSDHPLDVEIVRPPP